MKIIFKALFLLILSLILIVVLASVVAAIIWGESGDALFVIIPISIVVIIFYLKIVKKIFFSKAKKKNNDMKIFLKTLLVSILSLILIVGLFLLLTFITWGEGRFESGVSADLWIFFFSISIVAIIVYFKIVKKLSSSKKKKSIKEIDSSINRN